MLAYINFLYSNSVSYAAQPSFSITVPSSEIDTAANYYVAAYDPTRPSLGWQLGFEGPGKISGKTLSFTGATVPYTFAAHANYYFGVYAISAAAASPTAAPSVAPIVPTPAPTPVASASPTVAPTAVASPTAIPTATPTLAPGTVALGTGGTITLTPSSAYRATLTLPTASTSTTATVSTSTTPPTGAGPIPVSAGVGAAIFYVAVTPSASITFTGGSITGSFSATTGSLGTGYYYLDLLAPGLGWLHSTSNRALASGSTVNFSYALLQPITLTAGTKYVFAISH